MPAQSKLLALPSELLHEIVQNLPTRTLKILRSTDRLLWTVVTPYTMVHVKVAAPFPADGIESWRSMQCYTLTCIRVLTLEHLLIDDAVWEVVCNMDRLEDLRLHYVQVQVCLPATTFNVSLCHICVSGVTNFRPIMTFVQTFCRNFWYLELHGYNVCRFPSRRLKSTNANKIGSVLSTAAIHGVIGRAFATLPKTISLEHLTTLDINIQLGSHLIQLTLNAVGATLEHLILRNIGDSSNLIYTKVDEFIAFTVPSLEVMFALQSACVTFATWNGTYVADFLGSSKALPSLRTVSLGIETFCENSDTVFEGMAARIDADFGQRPDTVVTLWIGFEKVVRGSVVRDTLTFEDSAAIALSFRKNCPILTAAGRLVVYPEPGRS